MSWTFITWNLNSAEEKLEVIIQFVFVQQVGLQLAVVLCSKLYVEVDNRAT